MKNILRALLFGVVVGVLLGVQFNERGRKRLEQEEHDAFVNDPETRRLRDVTRRMLQTDEWLDEFEGNEP
jgi:hypothetical protein